MDDTQIRAIVEEILANQEKNNGMTGFDQRLYDKVMSDPNNIESGAQMAGLLDDNTSMALMRGGDDGRVPYGGKLSPFQAAANGIEKGIGLYNLLNAQKVKANALRNARTPGVDYKPASMITDPHEMDDIYGR